MKTVTLTLTEDQMKAVGNALQVYGRMRFLQFDFVLDDLMPNCSYDDRLDFEKEWKSKLESVGYKPGRIGQEFEIGRSIHAFFHGYNKDCCPCWRSLDPWGKPEHRIEAMTEKSKLDEMVKINQETGQY